MTKTLLVFHQSHDYQHSSARQATLAEALDEVHSDEVDVSKLVPPDADSFDWKEYSGGEADGSQVSWGDQVSADFYDDLYQDEGCALFVNGVQVWHS